MMVLSYPNNPTTATAPPWNFWHQAVAFCKAHDIALVHDFPYGDVTFTGKPAVSVVRGRPPIKKSPSSSFSMSKSYNMGGFPGWVRHRQCRVD
jgi:aspartate/methionine/tyrosine aminotransferase